MTARNRAVSRDRDGRSPLMAAAATSLKWKDTKRIFDAYQPAIYETDAVTGLPVSLLAAVGPSSDLESVYRLCRENPPDLMPRSCNRRRVRIRRR